VGSVCKTDGSACTGCNVDGDCNSNKWCNSGSCVNKGNLGAGCGGGNQCLSGNCVDGVCCSAASCGYCQLCSVSGSKGNCTIATGQNPHGNTCTADVATCQQGVCNAAGNCNVPDTTPCMTPTCASAMLTNFSCANGSCGSAASSCGAYQCNGSANGCLTTCTGIGDCTAGNYCDSTSHCVPQNANGGSCTNRDECTSNNCVDGVCCDMGSCGQCQACNLSGSLGTCSAVKNADDPDSCNSTTSTCDSNGACKLKDGQPCGGSATNCAKGFCADTVCCDSACDTADACNGTTSVDTYSCNTSGMAGTCKLVNIPCGGGQYCTGGACTPCNTDTACGPSCTNCAAQLNNQKCVNGGTVCGCVTTADCDPTGGSNATADGCNQIGGTGPSVCLCGTMAACSGGASGTHCKGKPPPPRTCQ
jgi:hypothetical protein